MRIEIFVPHPTDTIPRTTWARSESNVEERNVVTFMLLSNEMKQEGAFALVFDGVCTVERWARTEGRLMREQMDVRSTPHVVTHKTRQ